MCPTLTRATGVLLTLKYESQDQASAHASAQVQQGQPTSYAAVPAWPLAQHMPAQLKHCAWSGGRESGRPRHCSLAEDSALGGQADISSRIEKLPEIFLGLSGEALAAPAALQARKFARIKLGCRDARAVIAH